jgi:hypothetical protein
VPPQPEAPSLIDAARYIRSFLSDARVDAMRQHVVSNQMAAGASAAELRAELVLLDSEYSLITLIALHLMRSKITFLLLHL